MAEELVAIYDPDDVVGRVVAAAPRSRVRAENLPHAATAVFVRRSDGRLLVHRRADGKDLWPGRHDVACGGVVLAGESVEEAARRELAEEVGVRDVALRPLLTTWYRDRHTHYLAHAYEAVWDGGVTFEDGEVAEAWWVTDADLAQLLVDPARPLVPDTRRLLELAAEPVADAGPWPVGATVLYRFGRRGRAGFVRAATVVHDGRDELVLWVSTGAPVVREVLADGRDLRAGTLAERARGARTRRMGRWRGHGIYLRIPAEYSGWSLWHFFDDEGGFRGWYGNLEASPVRRRTALGSYLVDTADRALDVWVPRPSPEALGPLTPRWKDLDEFAALTGTPGRWTAEQAPRVRRDGERLMDSARARAWPFDDRWTTPPDPLPARPALPPDWDLPHLAGP